MIKTSLDFIHLELKKNSFYINLIISILLMISIFTLCELMDLKIEFNLVLLKVIPYIIIINFSFSLGQEFTYKTDKILFSGIFKRTEILFFKLLIFLIMNILLFIAYEIVFSVILLLTNRELDNMLNVQALLNNFYVFVLYAFTIGSFILLISVCTKSSIFAGIITYLLYFDITLSIITQAIQSSKNIYLKYILQNIPFYVANTSFYSCKYNFNQFIVMFISGVTFLILSCIVINKRNI